MSPQQTTLYDQIEFTGQPSSFAWVLPITGQATIGLSADILFQALDRLTTTQVIQPQANCPLPPSCFSASNAGAGSADGGTFEDAASPVPPVNVLSQEQVGPYETVQLQSTDPQALNSWLTQHGYNIPPDMQPVIAAYVNEKFDFLAMKLAPSQGVQAMRPVRVTTPGASPVLPLRMVAAGTGATTGITLWVVGDGRWEPQNFPSFLITDDQLIWDWATSSSNYKALRATYEAQFQGAGWEVESSMSMAQQTIASVVTSGYYGGGGPQPPYNPEGGTDYLPIEAGADGGPGKTATQVEQDDLNTLFAGIAGGTARITRMRSDIAHAALASDLVLQASGDQSELSSVHNVTKEHGQPQCRIYDPNSCAVIGYGPRDEVAADGQNAGSGGCATTPAPAHWPGELAMAALVGLLGLASIRARRRR